MQLLEREAQLQTLTAALHVAGTGSGTVAFVYGEAGIGKTSLVEHFLQSLDTSWRVLRGACDSLFTPRALGPLHDIALETGGELLKELQSGANRNAIFAACLSELGGQPTVVVIEDIHWADDATLDLLKYLGRRIRQSHVLLILTYRDDELGADHPLRRVLGDLGNAGSLYRIPVPPLSSEAVGSLAGAKKVDVQELCRLTNGNPFFVTEVLATARGIPETVRDAVLARAAQLSPSARRALEAAAVIGLRVEPWLLSKVAAADADHIEDCFAAGVLEARDGYYAFRHELARQTILGAVEPGRLISLHRLVLGALEESAETRHDLERLASHAAGTQDASAVLQYAPAAAERASALGAHRQAHNDLGTVLRYAEQLPPERRAALLDRYADECEFIDELAEADRAQQEALRLWRELGKREQEGRALRRLSEIALKANDQPAMALYVSQAIAALEQTEGRSELAMAYSHKSRIHMVVYEAEEAIDWGERAIRLAEALGNDETLMHALNNIGIVQLWHDQPVEGRQKLERSLQLALAGNHHDHAARAYYNLASGLLVDYDYTNALAYADEGLEFCIAHDLDNWRHGLWSVRGRVLFERGDWVEAEAVVRSAPDIPGHTWMEPGLPVLELRLRLRRGDLISPEALDAMRSGIDATIFQEGLYPMAATAAEAAWLAGDLERCRLEAQPRYDNACALRIPKFMGELGLWMWRAGAITKAPVGAAKPYALQINGDWRAAAAMWKEFGCPYERGMALMDGDEAAQRQALRIFEDLGARPILEKLRQQMRARGVRRIPRGPRPSTRDNAYGLTAREIDVFTALVTGAANSAIAKRLSLSTRTVEHHIASILQKTGTQSRSEAIALALRENLIVPD